MVAHNSINYRYNIISTIGKGGMGIVYHIKDKLSQTNIALKSVPAPIHNVEYQEQEDLSLALAREFRTLATLRHPNIISVLDYGFSYSQDAFFTMDLLQDAQDILSACRKVPQKTAIIYIIQLVQALHYLHYRGIIHRDLKPHNVLVTQDGRVKVLDFGLAIHQKKPMDTLVAGTLTYIAPEILLGEQASPASDLYAIGLIFYEIIVGHFPFNQDDIGLLLQQQINDTPDLSSIDSPILFDILSRLLEKEPQERYRNTQELINELAQYIEDSNLEEDAIRESYLVAAEFIGRDHEMKILTQNFSKASETKGAAWTITGESGIGKSRLLQEVEIRALVHGMWVLKGNSIEEETTAYQSWGNILRHLVLLTELDDHSLAILELFVPNIKDLVERPLPQAKTLEPRQLQKQIHQIIIRALRQLEKPTCIIIDDAQWLENGSIALIQDILKEIETLPITLFISYRDDERLKFTKYFQGSTNIKLERLVEYEIKQLVQSMIGQAKPDVVKLVQDETEGNIYFMVEVIRALEDLAGNRQNIGETTLPRSIFSGSINAIIHRRLSLVSEKDQALLQIATLIGRRLDPQLLQHLQPEMDIEHWLTRCSNGTIIEVRDDQWFFTHDQLRKGLINNLETEKKILLHKQIVEAITTVYADTITAYSAQLAYHYSEANQTEKASDYTMYLGEQEFNIGQFDDAIKSFQKARALLSEKNINRHARLFTWEARTNEYLNNSQIAEELYLKSYALYSYLDDEEGLAISNENLGELANRQEDHQQAIEYLSKGIAIYRSLDKPKELARALNKIGNAYMQIDREEEAIECYTEALELSRAKH